MPLAGPVRDPQRSTAIRRDPQRSAAILSGPRRSSEILSDPQAVLGLTRGGESGRGWEWLAGRAAGRMSGVGVRSIRSGRLPRGTRFYLGVGTHWSVGVSHRRGSLKDSLLEIRVSARLLDVTLSRDSESLSRVVTNSCDL